jgi:hypothetical protein
MILVVGGAVMLGLASLVFLAACGAQKISEPFNDSPRGREFSGPADVVTMPDGFGNIATKCGPGGMRYTTLFHSDGAYGGVSVVPDGSCPK